MVLAVLEQIELSIRSEVCFLFLNWLPIVQEVYIKAFFIAELVLLMLLFVVMQWNSVEEFIELAALSLEPVQAVQEYLDQSNSSELKKNFFKVKVKCMFENRSFPKSKSFEISILI